ncbi:MAG: J domain-containing protein [Rhodoferax sp.]|nr:J domain-containing protein [Rhodoferax sp.]MCF8209548.1 J domain-containing protein [Rhodoferax sp.]
MKTPPTTIQISQLPDRPSLSKNQNLFNDLVRKIQLRRDELAQWQEVVEACRAKAASEMLPLLKKFREQQTAFLDVLVQGHALKGLTKTDRRVLGEEICELAEFLLEETGDPKFKEIFNQFSPTDYDEDEDESEIADVLKNAVANAFGMDPADYAHLQTPEEVAALAQAQLNERRHHAEVEQARKDATRKKTPKQLAREAAAKAAAEEVSLSIREVYRKLVSALHPDREPDADERARKTALMQRVNQAYEKRNLLQLLELQLELEHIDAHSIAGLSASRLKHFNQVLREQLAELEQEINALVMPYRLQFGLFGSTRLKPSQVMTYLNRDIANLRRDLREIQKDLQTPQTVASLKFRVKARQREAKAFAAEERMMRDVFGFDADDKFRDDCPF